MGDIGLVDNRGGDRKGDRSVDVRGKESGNGETISCQGRREAGRAKCGGIWEAAGIAHRLSNQIGKTLY